MALEGKPNHLVKGTCLRHAAFLKSSDVQILPLVMNDYVRPTEARAPINSLMKGEIEIEFYFRLIQGTPALVMFFMMR